MNALRPSSRLWLAALAVGLSCGSPSGPGGQPVTRLRIGPAGGQVSANGGRVRLTIPPGALTTDKDITIAQVTSPASGDVGPVYDIGPSGTQFAQPVLLSLRWAAADVASGLNTTKLHVATLSAGAWVPVQSTVTGVNNTVAGQITHLSPWTLIVYDAVVPPEPPVGGADGGTAGATGGAPPDGGVADGAAGATGGADAGGGAGGAAGKGGTGGSGGASGPGGASGKGGSGGSGGGAGAGGAAGKGGAGGAGGGQAGATGTAGSGGQSGSTGTAGSGGQSGAAGGAAGATAGAGGSAAGSGGGGVGGDDGSAGGAAGDDGSTGGAGGDDAGTDADPDAPTDT